MRRLLSVSILALSLAMASPAGAQEWFRLNMSPTIFFGTAGEGETPDGGVNNNIDINIDAEVNGRVYGSLTIPVSVSGIDATYAVSVTNLPSGATWTADTQVYGAGNIQWPSAAQGTYRATIEVRDAHGALVATSDLEIVVHVPLAATVSQPVYEVEVGGELSIVPEIDNLIGGSQWGSIPSPLPEWLNFDATTGTIDVDTAAPNSLADIVLTTVDQGDLASASTLPFSISVNGADTNYWAALLGGSGADFGYAIASGPDGSIYVSGVTMSAGAGGHDLLLAKYTLDGEFQWNKTLGGASADQGWSVAVGPDGAAYVAGSTQSAGAGNKDLLLIKYSSSGDLIWKKTLGGTSGDGAASIAAGADGSLYVAGSTQSINGYDDVLLAKYSSSGELSWKKALVGTSYDYGMAIAEAADGSVYVSGATQSVGAGNTDALIAKYTSAGELVWQRTLGGAFYDYGDDIAIGSDGSVFVTGRTQGVSGGDNRMLVAKLSASGALQWQKSLSGPGTVYGSGIAVASDSSIYVSGPGTRTGASLEFVVAKLTPSGDLSWQKGLGGTGQDESKGLAIGPDGALYVTGQTNYAGEDGFGGWDILTARLPSDGGEDMTAGPFTWRNMTLTVTNPGLSFNSNPNLPTNANPNLTHGSNPGLTSGDGATLTSTTTPFVEE
ncbi:hypothetical protein [Devosia sp. DBB001]|nr:hypothetical protein [Devosia sp. DBB001]